MPERRLAVLGAGAVGGYLAGRGLDRTGASVTLICRPAVAEAIRERGLRVREQDEEIISHPTVATAAREVAPCDLTLLTVRTYDVPGAVKDVQRLMGSSGLVAAFQNGVGTEDELAAALGRDRVVVGTLTVSVGMDEPGVVTRYSRQGGIALAMMDGSPVPGWVRALFAGTGLPTLEVADWRSLRWSKLLLNMLAAATSAILDMDITALMRDPRVFRIEQLAIRETGRVMDRQGIRTTNLPGYPARSLRLVMRLSRLLAQRLLAPRIVSARAGRSPGTRRDMDRGRSEIRQYNGAVAARAAVLGVPAPVNAALAKLAADLLIHPERRAEFRGQPDRLVAYLSERGIEV